MCDSHASETNSVIEIDSIEQSIKQEDTKPTLIRLLWPALSMEVPINYMQIRTKTEMFINESRYASIYW